MEAEAQYIPQILAIAEELISRNLVLDAKRLYYEVKRRIPIERKVLLRLIQSLMEKRILIEGTKLTKDLVLANSHRKQIYKYITSHIGTHFSTIKERYKGSTGSPGQLIWHLEVLVKFEFIRRMKYKRYTLFLPFEFPEEVAIEYFLLRNELNRKILNIIIKEGTVSISVLLKSLGWSRDKVKYRINLLVSENILALQEGNNQVVCMNSERRDEILELFNKVNTQGGQ